MHHAPHRQVAVWHPFRHHVSFVRAHGHQRHRPRASASDDYFDGAPAAEPSSKGASGMQLCDYPTFVRLFRQASPYIEGHRGRTFVVVIPGEVTSDRALLQSALSDVALLHGLGVQLVLVTGVSSQIDRRLRETGRVPKYLGGYRITDRDTLATVIDVAGEVRVQCLQCLSKGPAIPMIRRHTKDDREIHFEPAMNVVSGNFVTAKRRGVIEGTDFGFTGEVRFVLQDAIRKQLAQGNVVLLSNLGFTAAGEVLNCNSFDVGLHAAVELRAEKIFFLHLDDVKELNLPAWLPLSDAQEMLLSRVEGLLNEQEMDMARASFMEEPPAAAPATGPSSRLPSSTPNGAPASLTMSADLLGSLFQTPGNGSTNKVLLNLDIWNASGFPTAVSMGVIACSKGVKRAHLLDARLDGGLLLELYSRDGVGTMISANFYEGIRKANAMDVDAVQALLQPLEREGILVKRSREDLETIIQQFVVIERETKLMGCAMLLPLGDAADGISVAELGAFTVDPSFRGSGRGDSMLDYVEQEARNQGVRRLVLLTTRTADWFEQRDFKHSGPAYLSTLIPESRRAKINAARNSQLYVKVLEACDAALPRPGKRIGF